MLRARNVTVRVAALAYVGIRTFTAARPGTAHGAVQIAAFTVAGIVMLLWTLAEQWQPSAPGRWHGPPAGWNRLVPWGLGLIAVTSGAAAAVPGGSNFIVLGLFAAIGAGTVSVAAGCIVTVLGFAAVEAVGLPLGHRGQDTLAYPVVMLVGLLVGLNRRAYRIQVGQEAALAARSEELHQEQARTAALNERTRIAREIHDVLAHSLGALGVQIELARAVLTEQHDEARAADLLDQARRITSEGLAETRRAVHALRGQTRPLPEGLAELSAEHQRSHGAPVTFQVTGQPRPLPPDAGLALTRTAAEALVNAAKYAPHQPVQMRLDYSGADTSLVVTSPLTAGSQDGSPEPALATVNAGYGLTGMRERLLLLDGTLSAGRSGADWVVEARVPR